MIALRGTNDAEQSDFGVHKLKRASLDVFNRLHDLCSIDPNPNEYYGVAM